MAAPPVCTSVKMLQVADLILVAWQLLSLLLRE